MINILTTIAGVFIVMLLISPIILLSILLMRTSKSNIKPNPQSIRKLEELEQNDIALVEDINEALSTIVSRLEAIEERLDREDQTVKGFSNKKSKE